MRDLAVPTSRAASFIQLSDQRLANHYFTHAPDWVDPRCVTEERLRRPSGGRLAADLTGGRRGSDVTAFASAYHGFFLPRKLKTASVS